MKNASGYTFKEFPFSAKAKKAKRLFTVLSLLVAMRPTLQKNYWTAYVSFLFAGPALWRWRKYAPFPRGVRK